MPTLKSGKPHSALDDSSDREYAFTLLLSPRLPKSTSVATLQTATENLDVEIAEALMEAGCNDAVIGTRDGLMYAAFDRQASSMAEAVLSAIDDVEKVEGVEVVRLEPEELVNATAIGERTGRSRESVRTLVKGLRGPGTFPPPAGMVGEQRVWRWPEVADWFYGTYATGQPGDLESALVILLINNHLEIRRYSDHLSQPGARRLLAEILRSDARLLTRR